MNKRRIIRRTNISHKNDFASVAAENLALKQKLEDVEEELELERTNNEMWRANYNLLREERDRLQQGWEDHVRKINLKDEMLEIKDAAIASLRMKLLKALEKEEPGIRTRKPRRFPSRGKQ